MKKLYLDYNIFVALIEGNAAIDNLISSVMGNSCFPVYSPAHIEEVAVSTMRNGYPIEKTHEKLRFISKYTNDYELLPFKRNDTRILHEDGIYLCEENPRKCYARVVEEYSRNDLAETIDKNIITSAEDNNFFSNDPNEINNSKHREVLLQYRPIILNSLNIAMKETYHRDLTDSEATSLRFEDLKNDFQLFECLVNIIFNVLEVIRFFPEKKNKSSSRLHDVSHAIYASYSEIFISGDKKLVHKILATYHFLGVPTKIIHLAYDKAKREHYLTEC